MSIIPFRMGMFVSLLFLENKTVTSRMLVCLRKWTVSLMFSPHHILENFSTRAEFS